MTITLIRHAEVEERYHNCYNGHVDIGLSQRGYEQARNLAEHFKGQNFDAVFCSDLFRARETLKTFEYAKDAIYTEKLREKSFGKHDGLEFDEIIAQGEIEYKDFTQWIAALDGEDVASFEQRVKEFFFNYLPSLQYENILVVTHAGVIKVLMATVQNLTLEEAFAIPLPYGSYTIYESTKRSFSQAKSV